MKKQKFDFGGWATKNDLLCADGRTIRKDAFKDDDGRTVPLVWQHNHEDPTRVIGHALLENRDDGVYAYCSFNGTDIAQHVKELVRHEDVNSLSIYANKLKQSGGDVLHGVIREVSVVLAGANPGAMIEFPIMEHGEESETEACIWPGEESLEFGEGLEIQHAEEQPEAKPATEEAKAEEKKEEAPKDEDDPNETVQDVLDTLNEEQKLVVQYLISEAAGEGDDEEEDVSHADTEDDGDGKTVDDVLKTLTPKQKKVVEFMIANAIAAEEDESEEEDEDDEDSKEVSHSIDEGEEIIMKKNVFDTDAMNENASDTLTHAQMDTLISDAKRLGSLKQSVLAHAAEYGIDQIEYLFPEDRATSTTPGFIQRDQGWVRTVMNGVHHTPFSRVKTLFADITEAEARAKGYLKGHLKKTEVFKLLKRSTDPQTIYKKQKLDRDDVVDITDFDVVAWLKSEMRMMLDEEIARAILVGDGREGDSDDHISEDHIRSIFNDDATLYVVRRELTEVQDEALTKTFIKTVRKAWKDYKGSGNCIGFITEDWLSDLLLMEDRLGHFMYPNKETLANVLGVKELVSVPVMADESTVRTVTTTGKTYKPAIIIVNLNDYNVGADKGGSVNMFEDFDIDYNAQKYLIETRCSGALVKPFSAIVIEQEVVDDGEGGEGGEGDEENP